MLILSCELFYLPQNLKSKRIVKKFFIYNSIPNIFVKKANFQFHYITHEEDE
jgi:hypothetical protein